MLFILGKAHIFLHLTGCLHSPPFKLFFRFSFSKYSSATACFRSSFFFFKSTTSSLVASRMMSPLSRRLPASKKSLLHLKYEFWWMSYFRQIAAMLSSPRNPSKTILIFSSAENTRLVRRLIYFTTAVAEGFFFLFDSIMCWF